MNIIENLILYREKWVNISFLILTQNIDLTNH